MAYKWSTIYIYHVDKINNHKVVNVDKAGIIVKKSGNKYKEIATGIKLKSVNIDFMDLKNAYQLRKPAFLKIFNNDKIIKQLDEVGVYFCVNEENENRVTVWPLYNDVVSYLESFKDSKLNYYLEKKKQIENNKPTIKKLIKSRNK